MIPLLILIPLAPYIIITILLTFPMLYFTYWWLFCNYQFVVFNPFNFFPLFFIVVQVQLSPFSPHQSLSPQPFPPSPMILPTLSFSICPLYVFLDDLSSFPLLSPPLCPLVTVSLFFISISLDIFCLLVCFVG